MNDNKVNREPFVPENIPLVGSLGLLALGDVGFEAWRRVKVKHNSPKLDEKK